MPLTVTHAHGHDVAIRAGEFEIARYVYEPYPERWESPKPYVHPLRTLAGDVVTVFRPHDHRWHKGLQLTATDVSGANLWGGNTYVTGEGYQALDNVGAMVPDDVADVTADNGAVTIDQTLRWVDAADAVLAHERRRLVFHAVDADRGRYAVDFATEINNAVDHALTLESPNARGMTGSGYQGLWWRGPRSFTDGTLLTPDGRAPEDDLRGRSVADVPWVAYVGRHDEVDRSSTLIFATAPENKGDAAHWFVRTGHFAGVNPSWAFHEPLVIPTGSAISRRYRVVVASGALSVDDVEEALATVPW